MGIPIAEIIPISAMTTINSTIVKPKNDRYIL